MKKATGSARGKRLTAFLLIGLLAVFMVVPALAGHMTSVSYGPGWLIPGEPYEIIIRVKDSETNQGVNKAINLRVSSSNAQHVYYIDYDQSRLDDGYTIATILLRQGAPLGMMEISAYAEDGSLLCTPFEIPIANPTPAPVMPEPTPVPTPAPTPVPEVVPAEQTHGEETPDTPVPVATPEV